MKYNDGAVVEWAPSAAIVINQTRSAKSDHRADVIERNRVITIRHVG